MEEQDKKAKNREYQQRYRAKKHSRIERNEQGKVEYKSAELSRIDVMVSYDVKITLALLAKDCGQSQKAVLERLILEAWENSQS